jgi:hypothetical protein
MIEDIESAAAMDPHVARGKENGMNLWRKVTEDLQKGLEEGITYVKEGAFVVKQKAEELTEEGKRRYKLYELKTKVQKEISELGGKVYEVSSKVRNPMLDTKVKAIKTRIEKLELEIMKLEGASTSETSTSRAKRPASKRTTAKKVSKQKRPADKKA